MRTDHRTVENSRVLHWDTGEKSGATGEKSGSKFKPEKNPVQPEKNPGFPEKNSVSIPGIAGYNYKTFLG
jgi:hypothetical protein